MILIDGQEFTPTVFPNGEKHYIMPSDKDCFQITMIYESDLDLTTLWWVKQYYSDHMGLSHAIDLIMPYIPYARMDRETPNGQPCSIRYFANFINSLKFDRVFVYDAHSNVALSLIDHVHVIPINYVLDGIINTFKPDYIVYPDVGALKKYSEIIGSCIPSFSARKERDINTGRITHINLIDEPDINEKKILIVDDICSKGTTAYLVARMCRELGASDVRLYVSHTEESIFDGRILQNNTISTVYTTNSLKRSVHNKIRTIDIL